MTVSCYSSEGVRTWSFAWLCEVTALSCPALGCTALRGQFCFRKDSRTLSEGPTGPKSHWINVGCSPTLPFATTTCCFLAMLHTFQMMGMSRTTQPVRGRGGLWTREPSAMQSNEERKKRRLHSRLHISGNKKRDGMATKTYHISAVRAAWDKGSLKWTQTMTHYW